MKKCSKAKILISLIILLSFYFLSASPEIKKLVFGQRKILTAQAQASPTITVRAGHPRLFITPENLPTLKQRAATTHKDTYLALKDWADASWNDASKQEETFSMRDDRLYDSGILRYALIYLLGQVSGIDYSAHSINDYGDKAVQIMADIIGAHPSYDWTASMHYQAIAIAYDWVNDRMTNSQKQSFVNWFRAIAGDTPTEGGTQGYRGNSTPFSLYPGLAFYGDGINDALAQAYVNFIPTYLDGYKAIDHMSANDGGNAIGLCYAWNPDSGVYNFRTYAQDLFVLTTATNLTIDDTFNRYPYMNGIPIWFLYGMQPGPPGPNGWGNTDALAALIKLEDCASWQWNLWKNDYPFIQMLRLMTVVAKQQGDNNKAGWITWLINNRFQNTKLDTTWDIIFNDRTTATISPDAAGLPKVKAFGWNTSQGKIDSYLENPKAGLGQVYMKSSWSSDTSTTQAVFNAPPYYYWGHQHFDSLNFSIFKGEPLALSNSGAYWKFYENGPPDNSLGLTSPTTAVGFPHHWYYYERTPAANSLLIMDPNEVITMDSSEFTQKLKDGGQRTLADANTFWGTNTADSSRDIGGLIKYEDSGSYTYSSADATKAYNSTVNGKNYLTIGASPKTTLVQRDFVYLKSPAGSGDNDYFVVFDRIDSTNPSFKKVFLLHTVGEPILNGTQSIIYGNSSNGLFQSDNTNYITVNGSKGNLFIKTLAPSATNTYKMGGQITTTLTQTINDTDGTVFQGPKINISVASTAEFTDKPVVLINGVNSNGQASREAFMCDGKTDTQLTGCIRGYRYFKENYPLTHNTGSQVVQEYAWMIREADDNDWISYPYDMGEPHNDPDLVKGAEEFGRWALRIETVNDETHTNFLNVLHPTVNMSETQMAATTEIDSTTGNMKGALINDSTNPRIVMFSPTTAQVSDVTYDASYSASLTGKHLITGLIPSASFDIYKNGVKIATQSSSNQGIVSFESTGGSTFRLVETGSPPPKTYNLTDFTNLVADWLQTKTSPADVNSDGTVNSRDLGIMMSHWAQ